MTLIRPLIGAAVAAALLTGLAVAGLVEGPSVRTCDEARADRDTANAAYQDALERYDNLGLLVRNYPSRVAEVEAARQLAEQAKVRLDAARVEAAALCP